MLIAFEHHTQFVNYEVTIPLKTSDLFKQFCLSVSLVPKQSTLISLLGHPLHF